MIRIPCMLGSLTKLTQMFPPFLINLSEATIFGNFTFLRTIPIAPELVEVIESFHAHVLEVARLQATWKGLVI